MTARVSFAFATLALLLTAASPAFATTIGDGFRLEEATIAGTERALLGPMSVRTLPGVGPATGDHLRRAGIHTVDEIAGGQQHSKRVGGVEARGRVGLGQELEGGGLAGIGEGEDAQRAGGVGAACRDDGVLLGAGSHLPDRLGRKRHRAGPSTATPLGR